jgi:hypothetical protein
MGVRTRGLDIKAGAAKLKADRAARLEAELVIDRWNPAAGDRPRHAVVAHHPGCAGRRNAMAGRFLSGLWHQPRDRPPHPLASIGTLVLGLRCSWCPRSAPMPKLLGLYALPPGAAATARPISFR